MFRNYLTVAIRNIARHKVYSFINIAGLAIGMACCALILLYVQHELSYDAFHAKGDRIYQMVRETRDEEGGIRFSKGISGPFAPALKANFPEVEHAVRVTHGLTRFVQSDNEQFYHPGSQTRAADPDFFRIFDFEFIRGDRDIALRDPYSVVIREDVAERYFGSEDPIGKVITFADGRFRGDHTVTGVVRVEKGEAVLQTVAGGTRGSEFGVVAALRQGDWRYRLTCATKVEFYALEAGALRRLAEDWTSRTNDAVQSSASHYAPKQSLRSAIHKMIAASRIARGNSIGGADKGSDMSKAQFAAAIRAHVGKLEAKVARCAAASDELLRTAQAIAADL